MKRTKSNHINFLLSQFENESEDTTKNFFDGYIKQVNPRIKVNEIVKPYHSI
jgi:hypothetical protein